MMADTTPDQDLRLAARAVLYVAALCLLAWLLGGCSAPTARVSLWQDQAGGSHPFTATVRCEANGKARDVEVRSQQPQVVRDPEAKP